MHVSSWVEVFNSTQLYVALFGLRPEIWMIATPVVEHFLWKVACRFSCPRDCWRVSLAVVSLHLCYLCKGTKGKDRCRSCLRWNHLFLSAAVVVEAGMGASPTTTEPRISFFLTILIGTYAGLSVWQKLQPNSTCAVGFLWLI